MTRDRIVVAPTSSDADDRRRVRERARRRGFRQFLLPAGDPLEPAADETIWRGSRTRIETSEVPGGPSESVAVEPIGSPEALERLLERTPAPRVLAVRWESDRLIPLENAIAQKSRATALWVVTDRVGDVPGALGALEHGADRVVIEVREEETVDRLEASLEDAPFAELSWDLAPITRVQAAGLGDRVLVDTTSLLTPAEGLLTGSSASFLFHIASEAVGSRYTRPRAFRVNAGAAHAYVLMADGTTRYLSELEAGDAVLVTVPRGPTRSVRVGRLKIERRPLVLVEAMQGDRRRTIFLQEAETVRVSGETEGMATTELARGMRVWSVALPEARHLGRAVRESIDER